MSETQATSITVTVNGDHRSTSASTAAQLVRELDEQRGAISRLAL